MSRLICDRWRTIYVSVSCVCGGHVSFYHCIFSCQVQKDHFKPVVARLSSSSLPLTMASLVRVGEEDVAFLAGVAQLVMSCQEGRNL